MPDVTNKKVKICSPLQSLCLFTGDEIVGATIHFDKLKKDDVAMLLEIIEPYDTNMTVLKKQDLKAYLRSPEDVSEPPLMVRFNYC